MLYTTVLYLSFTDFTEQNNAIGYVKADDIFTPLTNFTFRFICKVSPPCDDCPEYNGFLVEVKTSGIEEKGLVKTFCLPELLMFT